MEKNKKAPVYLWTGNGWGKTTSALGAALRVLGQGYAVSVVQFMKGRKEIGEYKLIKQLKKKGYQIEIKQFGRKGWVNLKKPSQTDKKRAQQGLEYAYQKLQQKPFLLILDEINIAVATGLLKGKEVLTFLDQAPLEVHLYLTGRYAPKTLIKRADYVNEVIMRKGPKKLKGEKGIDY